MPFQAIRKTRNATLSWLVKVALSFMVALTLPAQAREIVFILGADLPGEPAYYGPATEHYRILNQTTPLSLVTTVRSLAEVREVLQRTENEGPWTGITLVTHGTPWRGLLTNIFSDGETATLENLENVLLSGEFPALPESRINSKTVITLESCGVGRRPEYLEAIARLFAGNRPALPVVVASPDFVAFIVQETQGGGRTTKRVELPVVIKTIPGNLATLSDIDIKQQVDQARLALDRKMAGAGVDAILAISPINIEVKVMLQPSEKKVPAQIAVRNEFVRNVARTHGINIGELKWELGDAYDADGMQTLKGNGAFILIRANMEYANSLEQQHSR